MPLALPLVIVGLLATIVMSYHVTIGTLKTKLKLNIGRQEGGEFLLLSVAAGEESDERGRATNFLQSLNTVSMEGEIIDWYDDEGKVVCPLPRRFVHSHNLLHRGIGVLLRRQTNEVYIHKRANSKRTWPGLLDAMIGGIGVSGSSSAETLVRELKEELELCVNAAPEPTIKFIGTTTIYTAQNQCIVDLYTVQLSPGDEERSLGAGDGEIAWGRWIDLHELQAMIKGDESAFVPSGLQCFRFIESNFLG